MRLCFSEIKIKITSSKEKHSPVCTTEELPIRKLSQRTVQQPASCHVKSPNTSFSSNS